MSGCGKGGKGLGKGGAKRHEPITRESLSLYDLRSNPELSYQKHSE